MYFRLMNRRVQCLSGRYSRQKKQWRWTMKMSFPLDDPNPDLSALTDTERQALQKWLSAHQARQEHQARARIINEMPGRLREMRDAVEFRLGEQERIDAKIIRDSVGAITKLNAALVERWKTNRRYTR